MTAAKPLMTTIAVYNSGSCVGRCDARCHEAKDPDCICGGKYHGKGSSKAAQAALTEDWRPYVEAWAQTNRVDLKTCVVDTSMQPGLF